MSFYSRYQRTRQFDDASLQTDVMRFMAIVAFCLIAILAVVRNIEAPAVSETIEPVVSTVQVAPTDQVRSTAPAPIPPKPESEETAQTRLLEPPIEPNIETKAAELMVEAQEPAQPMASLEVLQRHTAARHLPTDRADRKTSCTHRACLARGNTGARQCCHNTRSASRIPANSATRP